MIISAPCVVSLTWTLSDAQNQILDELTEPVEFFYGGNDLLTKVEEALLGQSAGFETRLQLEPEQAFGEYKPQLVCFEERALFPPELEVGMGFEGLPAGSLTPDMPADVVYVVTEVYASHVVLDGNHPLAGMALRLHLQVRDVREATVDEVGTGGLVGADEHFSVLSAAPAGTTLN